MRVDMVSEHASPLATLGGADAGGQNVHVARLSEALARRGVKVVIHTRREDPMMPDRVPMAPGITVRHITAGPVEPVPKDDLLPHMPAFARRLAALWAQDRPDVVHAHFWMSGFAALAAARRHDIPILQTFHALGAVKRRHQGAADTSPPQRCDVERAVARRVDEVLATCRDEVAELGALGVADERLTVVPCGVDVLTFRPKRRLHGRRELGRGGGSRETNNGQVSTSKALARLEPASRTRLLTVGRLVARKGIDDVIRALTQVPDAELIVAGGPPAALLEGDGEYRRLRRLADECGVGHRVDFLGCVDHADMPALIRSADAVVCAPWYEPFGIVALEAMACGVPTVVTAVGGMLDTVLDGVTGVHVPPRDPRQLAAALRSLMVDPARRARMGAAGRRRAVRGYTWDRVAAMTLEAYVRASSRQLEAVSA